MHLIPSVPFTEEELLIRNLTRQTHRKLEVFQSTVSYAILAELQEKAEKGDMVAIATLNDPHSAVDYFRFIMVLAILHKRHTAVKDVKPSKARGRRIYKIQYYIDDEGTPIMLNTVAQTKNKLR
jgi:ribosomal protein S8